MKQNQKYNTQHIHRIKHSNQIAEFISNLMDNGFMKIMVDYKKLNLIKPQTHTITQSL